MDWYFCYGFLPASLNVKFVLDFQYFDRELIGNSIGSYGILDRSSQHKSPEHNFSSLNLDEREEAFLLDNKFHFSSLRFGFWV